MAQKKRQDAGFAKLKKDLSENNLGNLYLFYGEEDYLRDYYIQRVQKKLLTEGMETFNLHQFQGKELDIQTLADCVDALPMMSERTVILVYDYDLFENESRRDRLEQMFQDLPEYVCLIFIYDLLPYKSGGNTKLGKLLKKVATVVEIDNSTAEYLTFVCGGLMTNLGGEIQKVGSYAAGSKITRADIDAVATPVLDAKVYELSKAVAARNFDQAALVLGELYQMNEEPIMILAVLAGQLRQMWSARLALESGKGQGYVADLWKLRSSWQAGNLMRSARQFDLKWCRNAVALAAETDLAMKSTGIDREELLTDLLLKLAAG